MTCMAKLLPQTLARIPGLEYRGIQEPNAALREAHEVRLAPPDDKSVGFSLPNPYDKEEEMKWTLKRMAAEKEAHDKMVKDKQEMEIKMAKQSMEDADNLKVMLKRSDAQFRKAARVHAEAIRAP